MKRYSIIVVFLMCGALLLGACKAPSCGSGVLEDTVWDLQSYGKADNLQPLLTNTRITAQFLSTGKIGGTAGCNAYFGNYQKKKNCGLEVSGLGATAMGCAQPIMDQEQQYLQLLQHATHYTVNDNDLRITSGQEILVYTRKGN